jgi:hypothetical protein
MAKRFKSAGCADTPFGPVEASARPPGELSEDEIKKHNSLLKTEQKLISQGFKTYNLQFTIYSKTDLAAKRLNYNGYILQKKGLS